MFRTSSHSGDVNLAYLNAADPNVNMLLGILADRLPEDEWQKAVDLAVQCEADYQRTTRATTTTN